ncbi:hypothetical protein DCC85_21885 [Paenibacillus sp. CAA11]|uniref:hypothetical protein n=1 Tax=Paenibacillus sp. CAA11 TaxID=1532905 RepID=UPI000D3B97D6|nr:hypothetical protein [Paenibacillus sp. CAA11]AWB46554.1 hypothetical protein DCC85_21885 [Paenibacillus sp. CAA11]
MSKLFEQFTKLAVLAAIILYAWTSFSSLDDKYSVKIMASTFSVSGEQDLEGKADVDPSDISRTGKALLVSSFETFHSSGLAKEIRKSSAQSKRTIAAAYGETDLRYHLRLMKGAWVPTTLDFSTNALYNISYILNTPSKLVHNLKLDFNNSLALTGSERIIFAIWDVLHAISGIWAAIIMTLLGSIIGLIFHPIQSVVNLLPSIWLVVTSLWEGISNFKNLWK